MTKIFILSAFIAALCGCAPERPAVSQESVTETSFDGSFLYKRFRESRSEGALIPGLMQDLVPQGMAIHEDRHMIIISNYSSSGSKGSLSILSLETGAFEKVLYLQNSDGTPHTGHLGGLAAGEDYLWIASGKGVYNLPYDLLKETISGETLTLPPMIETETKGSFATFYDGYVWIGEFTRSNGDYPVSRSHWRDREDGKENRAWLGAYLPENLMTGEGSRFPDMIYSIPDEVQGAAFSGDMLYLSMSFGRKNYSRIGAYHRGYLDEPDEILQSGKESTTPLWILDESHEVDEMVLPPMSEAVVLWNNDLIILFESGASRYRDTALFPLDRIQHIPQNTLGEI